jgi:hypothetical protein
MHMKSKISLLVMKVRTQVPNSCLCFSGACIDMVGTYSMSLIRAMLTCCVPLSEFGKIYSVIAACDNLLPMILSQAYASVWIVSPLTPAISLALRNSVENQVAEF